MDERRPIDARQTPARIDATRPAHVSYIDRTRDYYLSEGYGNPYRWAAFDAVPFQPLTKPLSACRVALITTAAPFQPDAGDQSPTAPYNHAAKFDDVYTVPMAPPPDLRIAHIAYDRTHTIPDDPGAYLPLAALQQAVRDQRIAGLPNRLYGLPSLRSQRHTTDIDAPALLRLCREDAVDVAVLPAV